MFLDNYYLKKFQCEMVRTIEEEFAQLFIEREDVRLFFINENQAFTDGKNIVVDPATDNIFRDRDALYNTEQWLKIPAVFSQNQSNALAMITRAQTIHEALHIMYSRFPTYSLKDERGRDKCRKRVLSIISNIIEDAYIEAVGCSEYDNLELYLLFGRVSRIFANHKEIGTVERIFGKFEPKIIDTENSEEGEKQRLLTTYLNYMTGFLLYPMLKQEKIEEKLVEYFEKTKQLFLDGSACGEPKKRYTYTQQIFDIIEPLIPKDLPPDTEIIEKMLGGTKTHSETQSTMVQTENEPKTGNVTKRLTTDKNGNSRKNKNIETDLEDFMSLAYEIGKIVDDDEGGTDTVIIHKSSGYDCSKLHKKIIIEENHIAPKMEYKKAYNNILKKYHTTINENTSRFSQLLRARVSTSENKKLFGTGINSRHLGDVKKRYWYKNIVQEEIPEIAVLFMVDGSGSMEGDRIEGVRNSMVILHEILEGQGIEHAIVEHRAILKANTLEHNIMLGFNHKKNDCYNIMNLTANDGTREGISLFWAESFLNKSTRAENKIIIALSDGLPYHIDDEGNFYAPPVSVKDTANAVRKIEKRGTKIVAIAMDNDVNVGCYEDLKEIYTNVVECTEMDKLTSQLLRIISKQLE